mgnify:CR=1 FL=1
MNHAARRRRLAAETAPLAARIREIQHELSEFLDERQQLEPVTSKGGADSVFIARSLSRRVVRAVVRVVNPHRAVAPAPGDQPWRVPLPGPARIDAEWDAYQRLSGDGLSPAPLWRTHDASACRHVSGVRVSRRLVRRRAQVWRYLDETLALAAAAHRRGVTHQDLNLGNIIDSRVGPGLFAPARPGGALHLIDFEYGPASGQSIAARRQLDVLTLLDEFARPRRGGRRLARDPERFTRAVCREVGSGVREAASGLQIGHLRHLRRCRPLREAAERVFPHLGAD